MATSRVRPGQLALVALVVLVSGCSPAPGETPQTGPDPTAVVAPRAPTGPVGRIRGVVRFAGPQPEPASDPITENQDVCGASASLPRLSLGDERGARHAFVYLRDAPGDGARLPAAPVLIDQTGCEYVPHALTVPLGTALDVVNSDAILHNVHGHMETAAGRRTVFNVAQPVQGQQTTLPVLTEPGIVHLTCEAGHPWMSAYVFVADHRYVTVTGDDGEFVLDDVPVGTHQLTMWHEGIRLERNLKSLQRYEYEEPYERTREVVVTEGAETVVEIELSLRALAP